MGIRFFCPNGHKLNVKDFQAGRKGICPFCGAKMDIPLRSTRPGGNAPSHDLSAETSMPAGTSAAAAFEPVDPLTESGGVAWYVRPAAGGQFGPANAEVMRAWLTEGRIGADSLVWREGWRDWREAGDIFCQPMPDTPVPGLDDLETELPVAPTITPLVRRRAAAGNRAWWIVGGLALTVLVLLIILIVVLKKP
jgi:hypothetical protein